MYSDGVAGMTAGLDANDATQITKGAELANGGIPHLNHAAALIKTHPCGS
jgi:hypothetical protein